MTDSGDNNNPSSQPFNETPSSTRPSSRGSLKCDTTACHEPTRPDNVAHRPSQLNSYMAANHGSSLSAHPPSALNMEGMSSALPGYQSNVITFDQYHHMQPQFAMQSPGVYYQMHPAPSFRGEQAPDGRPPAYSMTYPVVYPHYYPQPYQQPSYPGFPTYVHSPPHPYVNAPMFGQTPGYGSGYYPSPYPMMLGHGPGPPPRPQMPPRSGSQHSNPRRPVSSGPGPILHTERPRRPVPKRAAVSDYPKTIVDGSNLAKSTRSNSHISVSETTSPSSSTATRAATPGGPRRTPKQSGPALWVGNLPHGISIVDVKEYFSQGVSDQIESVFLISRSHCAFINYKTEAACSAAHEKFHDSRFQGCRLVCRLRPNARPTESRQNSGDLASIAAAKNEENDKAAIASIDSPIPPPDEKVPNRYFIVKSMTVEDLETSRQSGIWATQTHNEVNLNLAYETADNVYLIFSANKSGEYYGYARMVSPIQEDEKLALEMPRRPNHITTEAEEPSVTLTQASSTARSGRIIDDPVRGTIFWEADTSSEDDGEKEGDGEKEEDDAALAGVTGAAPNGVAEMDADTDANGDKNVGGPTAVTEDAATAGTTTTAATTTAAAAAAGSQAIGRPFRIQWLSTVKVPFYRTRGLRNPWNSNRGVKIARDGTEIEPRVGAQLVEFFHLPSSGATTSSYRLPN